MILKCVCVFCGSGFGLRPEYQKSAERLGHLLAEQGVRLVYGGAKVGLMGAIADAALAFRSVRTIQNAHHATLLSTF